MKYVLALVLALLPATVLSMAAVQQGNPDQQETLVPESPADLGQAVYGNCSGCHGLEGEGGFGPAFTENETLRDTEYVIDTILHGTEGMPPFAEQLSDERIGAVATHIRTSWTNDFGEVTPELVAEQR